MFFLVFQNATIETKFIPYNIHKTDSSLKVRIHHRCIASKAIDICVMSSVFILYFNWKYLLCILTIITLSTFPVASRFWVGSSYVTLFHLIDTEDLLTEKSLFYSCPPRTFLPALCRIFLDETAPDNVLEVTARAITYYLDVSAECTRRIVAVDGAIKALCNRLVVAEMTSRTSKDLAEQCIKVSYFICSIPAHKEVLKVHVLGQLGWWKCFVVFMPEPVFC